MATDRNLHAQARDLYAKDGLTLACAAKRLKVSERTVTRWKSEDAENGLDWGKLRASTVLGRESKEAITQELLLEFLVLHKRTLEEVKSSEDMTTAERVAAINSLTDTFTKQMRACALSAPQLNEFAIASEVFKLFADFVAEKHPDAQPALEPVLEAFGPVLTKRFG